jgi:hypothetical protein
VNLDTEDPVGARNRAILFGLVTLVVLGIVIGLSVGIIGSRAVDSTGLDDVRAPNNPAGPTDDPIEDFTAGPTPTEDTFEPATPDEPTETTEPSPTEPSKTRDPREATLNASPLQANTSEQVSLTGRFPGLGAGILLQVQRREGGVWTDFPVTMTTDHGGVYSTWIITGHTGANRFRIKSETGVSTPTVIVQIT